MDTVCLSACVRACVRVCVIESYRINNDGEKERITIRHQSILREGGGTCLSTPFVQPPL